MDTQETKIYIAALIAAGVLALILLYFIITMIKQQRRTQRLNLEKMQAEIFAQEKERKRIASDLHDDLGPVLSGIKFKINSVDLDNDDDKEAIESASQHIDDTLSKIRELSFDLMPNTLIRKGLAEAIEEFIAKMNKLVSLRIDFKSENAETLSNEMKVNLYRIILEIINNTIKHSKANKLTIGIRSGEKKIVLISIDDGVGFDYTKMQQEGKGLGLKNIQSRTEIMHGEMVVYSQPGKGTQYSIEMPIN